MPARTVRFQKGSRSRSSHAYGAAEIQRTWGEGWELINPASPARLVSFLIFNGWGDGEVEQNYSAAFRCYLAASKMGHVEALSNLGSMYWHGQGCSANRELAMECLEAVEKHRGAAPGDARA